VSQQSNITEALPGKLWAINIFATLMLKVAADTDIQHFELQCDQPELLVAQ
jgi:hypothetical protein